MFLKMSFVIPGGSGILYRYGAGTRIHRVSGVGNDKVAESFLLGVCNQEFIELEPEIKTSDEVKRQKSGDPPGT
jgi:hypothetical protein